MTSHYVQPRSGRLPVKNNLNLATILSLLVALIMAGVSAAGLLYPSVLYPTEELLATFVPNDLVNLALVLPLLLISVWLARRGKLIGLLLWPGMLFTVLYVYLPYVLAIPLGPLFLPYVALLPLSAGTLIGLIASIDGETVRQQIGGDTLARVSGGILLVLGVLIIGRQSALAVGALTDATGVDPMEWAVWIGDFTIASPALLIVGIQLWRRKALGYVSGMGLFLAYGVLVLALFPVMLFQAARGGPVVGVVDVVVLLLMAALCLVPFGFFVRRATARRTA